MTHTRISFKKLGGHVHTDWWSGKAVNWIHGCNGQLVFTLEEWATIKPLLEAYTKVFEFVDEGKP